jgi:cytochrome c553
MYCRICGDESSVQFRNRSGMALCPSCHRDTPTKASYETFLRVTGMPSDSTAREFFSDYKASRHSSVSEYWAACAE